MKKEKDLMASCAVSKWQSPSTSQRNDKSSEENVLHGLINTVVDRVKGPGTSVSCERPTLRGMWAESYGCG